jgi:hypothetical protein
MEEYFGPDLELSENDGMDQLLFPEAAGYAGDVLYGHWGKPLKW